MHRPKKNASQTGPPLILSQGSEWTLAAILGFLLPRPWCCDSVLGAQPPPTVGIHMSWRTGGGHKVQMSREKSVCYTPPKPQPKWNPCARPGWTHVAECCCRSGATQPLLGKKVLRPTPRRYKYRPAQGGVATAYVGKARGNGACIPDFCLRGLAVFKADQTESYLGWSSGRLLSDMHSHTSHTIASRGKTKLAWVLLVFYGSSPQHHPLISEHRPTGSRGAFPPFCFASSANVWMLVPASSLPLK